MDSIEEGCIYFELLQLDVALKEAISSDATFKFDIELKNTANGISWAPSGSFKIITTTFQPQSIEMTEKDESFPNKAIYRLSSIGVKHKTQFIELNDASMTCLANAFVVVKVVMSSPVIEKASKKTDKAPTFIDDTLLEAKIPLIHVLQGKDGVFNCSSMTLRGTNDNVLSNASRLNMQVSLDSYIAEYVIDASYLSLPSVTLYNPPASWITPLPVEKEGKGKNKATPQDLKAKYLESVNKMLLANEKIAQFSFSLNSGSSSGELGKLFPVLLSTSGILRYDTATAEAISAEEFNKDAPGFWSVVWEANPIAFLHRKASRLISKSLSSSTELGCKFSKSNLSNDQVVDVSTAINGTLNIQELKVPNTSTLDLNVIFTVEPAPEPVAPVVNNNKKRDSLTATPSPATAVTEHTRSRVILQVANPLVKPSPQIATIQSYNSSPSGQTSARYQKIRAKNVNAVAELQAEILRSIRRIADEYTLMYPTNSNPSSSSNNFNKVERKTEFMQNLVNKGILREVKENLKPKLQQAIYDRYGPRGHALGKDSEIINNIESLSNPSLPNSAMTGDKDLDRVLSDMYVSLSKQCNIALNQVYKETVIDKHSESLDNQAERYVVDEDQSSIDDESQSVSQRLARLLSQANDSEASDRPFVAEQAHLERIQIVSSQPQSSVAISVAQAYADYGEFCLRFAGRIDQRDIPATINADSASYWNKGREAVKRAVSMSFPLSNHINTLHVCCMIEASLKSGSLTGSISSIEDELFRKIIFPQLGKALDPSRPASDDGYETDELLPGDPEAYTLLAIARSLAQKPILARRALSLANKSYIDGAHKPAVSEHGSPRRTLTYLLSKVSVFLFLYGFPNIARAAVRLAVDSDDAVTKKAQARNLPAVTVPFIRHKFLLAKAMASASSGASSGDGDPQELAELSRLSAVSMEDKVAGCLARAQRQSDSLSILESYMLAIQYCQEISEVEPSYHLVPLSAWLIVGRLLIDTSRFQEATSLLTLAISTYPESATLFLLIGISNLRIGNFKDAEVALQHANVLDNRYPEVWGSYALLCLQSSLANRFDGKSKASGRIDEADKCIDQAIRLGLSDEKMLVELCRCYQTSDRLSVAERLARLALTIERGLETRVLLAEILAAKGQTLSAIEEYRNIVQDSGEAASQEVIEKCAKLLEQVGKFEDASDFRKTTGPAYQ